ncbi:DUF1028 domain-containing protein [Thermincola ferriacetica]
MAKLVATYSICGLDPKTGEIGVAVQSKFMAVGAIVPYGEAGTGIVATQSWANTSFGPDAMKLLKEGKSPQEILEILLAKDEHRELRQVGILSANGDSAAYTGKDCFPWAGHKTGPNFSCQGNILVGPETVEAMAETFIKTEGDLAERLLKALEAGTNAGGDKRGKQSAALVVLKEKGGYGGFNDRYIDLRVDDHPEPVRELIRLHGLYKLYFYKTRPENVLRVEGDLFRELQQLLADWGYYKIETGAAEPTPTFWEALHEFHLMENFDERIQPQGFIDLEVVEFMRKKTQ